MDCARKYGRYGHRDATMILVAYRHGLRASEVCDLLWQQIELSEGRLHVHRVKNGIPSVHPIRGDEMRALRKLRRDYPREAYVFVSERGGPISPIGFHRLIQRVGETAKMPFPIHPHTCAECSCARGSVVKFTMLGVRFLDADPSLASLNPQAWRSIRPGVLCRIVWLAHLAVSLLEQGRQRGGTGR